MGEFGSSGSGSAVYNGLLLLAFMCRIKNPGDVRCVLYCQSVARADFQAFLSVVNYSKLALLYNSSFVIAKVVGLKGETTITNF